MRIIKQNLEVLSATIAKEITIFSRYLPNLAGTILQLGLRLLFFLFFSGIASYKGALSGKNLFLFFGAALLLYVFYSTSIWAPLNSVTNDLYNGTLEYLYVTPASKFSYYFGTGLSNVVMNMVFFIPMFIFLSIYSGCDASRSIFVLFSVTVGIINCISLGVLISLLGIVWKQVSSITGILSVLFEFVAGAYAPVEGYPQLVKCAAYGLPFTWGYDLTRHYLMGSAWTTLEPVLVEWLVYIGMAVLYTVLAVVLMAKIQKKVLSSGLNMI